jgi:DNA replication protein DnaC
MSAARHDEIAPAGLWRTRNLVLTSNKAFKQWATIFNGDSTITSAVLDRLLHHAETVLIEGSSYRMKDRIES